MPYVDIPIIVKVLESPSYVEFSTAQLAAGSEARYLSEQNLLQKSPAVQERETDPQPIAEWCAGPKPGEDDQHRIVDGWDALLKMCGRDMRDSYPDLHFVRGKPIKLVFRARCCPVVGTCVMGYAFNHRDLRVEEDVSDLEFVSYFGGVPHSITRLLIVLYMMWKTDKNSVWDRGVRLRAGGDLE